jgi:hypothetical protein
VKPTNPPEAGELVVRDKHGRVLPLLHERGNRVVEEWMGRNVLRDRAAERELEAVGAFRCRRMYARAA